MGSVISCDRPPVIRFIVLTLTAVLGGVLVLIGGVTYLDGLTATGREVFTENPLHSIVTFTEYPGRYTFCGKERINVLVLGIDYNYTRRDIRYTKGARSDTILVVSLDPQAKFLNVVSIPRDTRVLISERYGYDKINSAYAYGGIEQAKETVSEFLGVPIDHYVIVKVDGAKRLVDALGGIAVDVEKDMDYDDNWGHLHIHLKKGPQILDGEQAVGYARFRMDEEGDRGRIRRQQQVIKAVLAKLRDPSVVTRLRELAAIAKENLETDFEVLELVDLANLYHDFDFHDIHCAAIVGDDAESDGISYIVPYAPANERIVRSLLKDTRWLSVDDICLQILDAGSDPDAARYLSQRLKERGFQVFFEGKAVSPHEHLMTTKVIENIRAPRMRGILESLLPPGTKFVKQMTGSNREIGYYDFTILVGDDVVKELKPVDERLPTPSYPVYHPSKRWPGRVDRR